MSKNGRGLHTKATREKRADRKRNDSKTQVPAVTTPPTLALNLPPSFSVLEIKLQLTSMNLRLYIFLSPTHKTKTNFLALS